eukprot:1309399-Pleurochrysis_carterae.AAC.1
MMVRHFCVWKATTGNRCRQPSSREDGAWPWEGVGIRREGVHASRTNRGEDSRELSLFASSLRRQTGPESSDRAGLSNSGFGYGWGAEDQKRREDPREVEADDASTARKGGHRRRRLSAREKRSHATRICGSHADVSSDVASSLRGRSPAACSSTCADCRRGRHESRAAPPTPRAPAERTGARACARPCVCACARPCVCACARARACARVRAP